jgi:hypothetical protein
MESVITNLEYDLLLQITKLSSNIKAESGGETRENNIILRPANNLQNSSSNPYSVVINIPASSKDIYF